MKSTKNPNPEYSGQGNFGIYGKNSSIYNGTPGNINVTFDSSIFDNYCEMELNQQKIDALGLNLPREVQHSGEFGFIKTTLYKDMNGCLKIKKVPTDSSGNTICGYKAGQSFNEVAHPNKKVNAISMVLPAESNCYAVIDIDDCIVNGNLDSMHPEFAKIDELLKTLDTYFEISMSGHGIHGIIGVYGGKPEFVTRTRNDYFELYFEKRVIALTGNILPGKPSKIQWLNLEKMKEVYDLLGFETKEVSNRFSSSKQNITTIKSYELSNAKDVEEVLANLRAYPLTAELIDGDWRNTKYRSKSQADAGLAFYSAVQSRCDKSIIRAVMYKSNLYTDDMDNKSKWERDSYFEGTINSAIKEVCRQNPKMLEYMKAHEKVNGE